MHQISSLSCFALLVGGVAVSIPAGARRRDPQELPHPSGWALAGQRLGPGATALLLGSTIYTAYTVVAVPGLTYSTGGFGLYALTYTLLLAPAAMVFLPRMRDLAAQHGLVTAADCARERHGSHALALAVALTGLLAAMPYMALQVVGLEAALTAMDISPNSMVGLLGIVAVCAVFTAVLLPRGLRACAELARYKALLLCGTLIVAFALVMHNTAGPQQVFTAAERHLTAKNFTLVMPHGSHLAYITLALGSVLAQLMYPQVLTVALATRSSNTMRRAILTLPLWTFSLGLFAYLGLAALALGVRTPAGHTELAVPEILARLGPPWLSGLLLGALAIAALLPAAVMAIGMATLVARNIYSEYFNPTATPKHEVRVARFAAVVITTGGLVFALALNPQDAINLHLLGGVWIIQTVPAVGLAPFTCWFHPRALLAGWAAGMVAGTAMIVRQGFSSVVDVGVGGLHLPVYVGIAALGLNLLLSIGLTPVLNRAGVPRGFDAKTTGTHLPRRGSRFAARVH